jgi:CRISPR/Cas system CMR subunit Cmr6 (Cas7 group RAMP superfamily)
MPPDQQKQTKPVHFLTLRRHFVYLLALCYLGFDNNLYKYQQYSLCQFVVRNLQYS